MSKNVQELAEELGIDKNELAAMINGMSLGLMGVTGSTILTPMDVERIKKKHEADKMRGSQSDDEAAAPVRRRSKANPAADGAVAPVRRRRKKVSAVEEDGDGVPPVRRRQKVDDDESVGSVRARRRVVSAIEPILPKRSEPLEEESPKKVESPSTVSPTKVAATPASEEEEAPGAVKKRSTLRKRTKIVEVSEDEAPQQVAAQDSGAEPEALRHTSQEAEEPSSSPQSGGESPTSTNLDEDKEVGQKEAQSKTTPRKESRTRAGYAAKIVHRPGTRTTKKPQAVDVEPIQQQPRRRTSTVAQVDSKRPEPQNVETTSTPATAAPTATDAPEVATAQASDAATTSKRSDAAAKRSDSLRAKVKSRPAPTAAPVADATNVSTSSRRRASSRKKAGATIVKKMDKSVVLDRLSAEGKDFTPGPKRGAAPGGRESGRRGSRKRVVEGTDLYGASSRRKSRKTQKPKKKPQKTKITEAAEHKRVIRVEHVVTVGDLARQMGVKAGVLAMKLLEAGMRATLNTTIDYETAAIIAEEFNYTVENVAFDISNFFDTEPDPEETLQPRAPVVTVMGHVDHGKTSLLDAIRSSSIASGEAGGITQHIGAYQVKTEAGLITFLDTPGHEAFTALRARGAKATDITVLVVAADDGVMPQTMEAINHSQDAGVPIVVAVNKIDKPGANVDRVKQALTEYNLVTEEWGGSTLFVEVSAKERTNIDTLIDTIMLQAELQDLRANPNRDAQGLVIEAELDVGRGSVATVLVQRGTLKQGDIIVSGQYYGKVRTMSNERGELVKEALPSQPVEITGLGGVPEAGEPFFVVQEEKDAKQICQHVIDQRRKEKLASRAKEGAVSLEDLSAMIKEGQLKELKVILKGDVQGSVEALKQAFSKLGNDEVGVAVIHGGVGGVTENDVNLAASSEKGAVIVGFNVRPDNRAQATAEKYGVKILTHSIIYDAIEQIRVLLEGMLEPIIEEETIGTAEVRDIFSAPKVGTVAGCYVTDGLIRRGAKARVVRDSRVMFDSTIESLRRFKDNVTEVKSGFECGLSIDNFNDIKIGDTIECYILKEVAAKL